jgi:hypothetical protein
MKQNKRKLDIGSHENIVYIEDMSQDFQLASCPDLEQLTVHFENLSRHYGESTVETFLKIRFPHMIKAKRSNRKAA